MPRRRRTDGDGNEVGRCSADTNGSVEHWDGASGHPPTIQQQDQYSALRDLLVRYALRDDGYLRIIPDGEQKRVYLKWKFTRNEWIGHYCFVSGDYHRVVALLGTLETILDRVDEGLYRPSRDRRVDS